MDGLGSQSGGNAWFEIADVIWSEADSILAESSETRRLISDSLSDQWEQESCTVFDSKFEELKNGGSFKNIKRRGGDERFAESVLEKGTLSDKISSMSVLLQENPIKHHHHLSKLIGMASSPARRVSNLAIEALTDLFSNYILPPSRKLRRFKNPIMLRRISALVGNAQWEDALFYAQWEDWLKIRFAEFVAALESLSMNTIENLRLSACNGAYSILKQRPEGEQALLSIIVNKLGDSSGKLADRVSHLLLELSKSFPQMRSVVKKEIDQIIFRNHVHVRAQRFGVLCLSQMKLSVGDREFAESLIETYIQLFEVEMKKRSREEKPSPHTNEDEKSLESKLLSCILTGINRALPYCREGDKKTSFSDRLIKRLDSLFRIVHSSNWAASVQCLGLLLQIVTDGQEFSGKLGDRFYRALYDRMIRVDRIFNGSSKLALFLNILYRSMKLDANTDRVLAFAKRLLQVSLYQQPEFICGALFLIARVHSQNGFLSGLMSLPPDGDLAESDVYDPMKRDPAYSNVKNSCLWELNLLLSHFHPSVRKFAEFIVKEEGIVYSGDPLEDFTTHAFLNRFVFRNPNQKHIASSKSKFMSTFSRQPANIHSLVGEFMQAPSTKEVKVDEDFFQKFFEEEKYRKPKKTQIAEDDLEDVDEELEKDEFMDEILERDLLNNEKSLGLPQSDDVEDDNGSYQSDEDDDKDSFGSSDNEEKLEDELDEDELVFNENGMSETLNDDEEDDDEILEFGAEEPVDYEIEKPVKKGSSKSSPFADLDELSQLFEGGLETADEKRLKGIDKWLKLQNKSGKKRKGTQAPAPQKSKKKSKSHKKK